MKRTFFVILISWAALFYSCTTNGTNWDVDALAPVVETTMDLTNMIGADNVQTNSDSSLWLNVDVDAFTFQIDTLAELPNYEFSYNYIWPLPTSGNILAGTTLPNIEMPIDLSTSNIELRESKIKTGILKLNVKSTNSQRLIFTYSIPSATLGGNPFSYTDTVRGLAPGEDSVVSSFDLNVAGYKINTTGVNNNEFNKFSAYLTISSIAGDPDMPVAGNQLLFKVNTKMVDVVPQYSKGYLGQIDLSQNNIAAQLEAMKMFKSGVVDVEQMSLLLTIHNTIGADLRFKPTMLKVTNTNNSNYINLSHSSIGNTVNLSRAFETGNIMNPVNPTTYSYTINSGNSNIESIVELLPDKVEFSADMLLNPYGNIGGHTDFYYTDYPAHIQMQLQAPLKFSINNLLMVDTLDNPFSTLDILNNIQDGQFIIKAENKFPLEAKLQIYTLNELGNITDSIMVNNIIAAAPVNALNRVINPVTSELIASVTPSKITHLHDAEKIQLKALFNTLPSSSGRMQMYSDYYLKIKLIADIKYNIVL